MPLTRIMLFTVMCIASNPVAVGAEPPTVIEAVPDYGDTCIDPALSEIRITFDQDMDSSSRSLCGGGESFPTIAGTIRWENARTIIVPVKLKAGHEYSFSVNCPSARGFRSRSGVSAQAHRIAFRTAIEGETPSFLSEREAAEMTDALIRAIDTLYSHRDIKNVEWSDLWEKWGQKLRGARSSAQFARIASKALSGANDLHLSVHVNGFELGTARRVVTPNVDRALLTLVVNDWKQLTQSVAGGLLEGDIGYLWIASFSGEKDDVDAAIEFVRARPGLKGWIIDVRANSGGNELEARRLASCFVNQRRVYSTSIIRTPSADGGFSGPYERVIEPAQDHPHVNTPVAILMGPVCMSSCESFLLMLHDGVRHRWFGANSWGSSGNPRAQDIGHGVTLYLPSWIDMTPAGARIEGAGLKPDVVVPWLLEVGIEQDPVLDAAHAWLVKVHASTEPGVRNTP